jgi:gamma-glutamyltranspeptidase/glutathione hydrolase
MDSAQQVGQAQQGRARQVTGGSGAVAAGHPLAARAAVHVLERGGNAVDATVAAQAVCAVVMPQACGLGGDALMLVRTGDGVLGLTGSGRSPAGAPTGPPGDGGASVTVPGAVQAWVDAVHRWGSLPLADCLAPALGLAADGFVVGALLAGAAEAQRARLLAGGAADWPITTAEAGDHVVQPELAALLAAVGDRGRAAFYEGGTAEAVAAAARRHGGSLTADDLAAHESLVGAPLRVAWDGGSVFVQPPPSQGVLLAMALQWWESAAVRGEPVAPEDADHVAVELTEAAFSHRDRCAADGGALLGVELSVDRSQAARRGGPRAYLHTTGVAVADAGGLVVSSLVSVFDDFGSAVLVPEAGIVLNDRAAGFTGPPNDAGPSRRPVHTLAPALLEQGGRSTALATPGADGQVQTLLQVLSRLRAGQSLEQAVGAPRWRSESSRLLVEASHPAQDDLAARGHELSVLEDGNERFGAVVSASAGPDRPSAVGDWRREVSAAGAA